MGFAFKLDLHGNATAELRPLAAGLERTAAGLDTATARAGKFDAALHGVARQTGALTTVDLVGLFRGVADVIGTVIGRVMDLGKWFVRTAADAQDLNLAMRMQLGEEGAGTLQRLADSFVNTRFDDDVIRAALLPLANAGIRDERMLDDIATAATDISVRFASGEAGFTAATEALGKIALRREVGERQLAALGLNEQDFLSTMAQQLGTTAEAVKRQISAGKIAAPTLLSVALSEIARKQGGELGAAALAGGRTLGSSLERLVNLPANMFKQLADSPAVSGIQAAIDGVVTALSGPAGQRIVGRIGAGLDQILGGISAENVTAGIERLVDTVFELADAIGSIARGAAVTWKVLRGLWAVVEIVGETIGAVMTVPVLLGVQAVTMLSNAFEVMKGAISSVVDHFLALPDAISDGFMGFLKWLWELPRVAIQGGLDVARAIIGGLIQGIQNAGAEIATVFTGLGEAIVGIVKRTLGISSPSRVFAELGEQTGAGMVVGLERSTGDVQAAMQALAAPPGALALPAPAGAMMLGAGGAGVTIGALTVEIHGADTDDPSALGRLVAEAARREILRTFDRLAVAA